MRLKKCFGTAALLASLLAIIAGALVFSGCASNTAPRGSLLVPERAQSSVYGCWIEVTVDDSEKDRRQDRVDVQGEFVAYDSAQQIVFVLAELNLIEVAVADIKKAKLTYADSESGEIGGWTAAGTVSTASHGLVAGLTAPLWLLVGLSSTAAQSHNGQAWYPNAGWNELRKYARYPQGLPAGFTGG